MRMKKNKTYILVADDEKEIRDILKLLLENEGYEVITAEHGTEVLQKAKEEIDLYILDVNMPEMTGFMVAMELRRQTDAPIIFLTAYSGEMDKIMGFSAGADDYVVKPFSNLELLMRVKAILRRRVSKECTTFCTDTKKDTMKNQIVFQDLLLDLDGQIVFRGSEVISLTYTEYKILELLVSHKKKIYSLDNIYQSIWKEEPVADSAIMVHIKNIRKKIGDDSRNPKYIKTAWGKGYYVE